MAGKGDNCYLGINGKKQGPMSEQDIRDMYDDGKITADTQFIRTGMKDWIPLSKAGIIDVDMDDDDGLPPLPSDGGQQPKKSYLGYVVAGLGLLLLIVVGGLFAIISGFGAKKTETVVKTADMVEADSALEADDMTESGTSDKAEGDGSAPKTEGATEVKKITTPAPENYSYGFLNFEVSHESSYRDIKFLFHNNTGHAIKAIKLEGKYLDKDGVVVAGFNESATDVLAGDKVRMESTVFDEDKATTLRVESIFVSDEYAGGGDYKGQSLPIDNVIPAITIDELETKMPSYFYTAATDSGTQPSETESNQTPEAPPTVVQTQPQIVVQTPPQIIVQTPPAVTTNPGAASWDYIIPQSNGVYLSYSDISYLSAGDLRLARNEIYARHGRLFKSTDLQAYFNNKAWYYGSVPADQFPDSWLNDYEKHNIELLQERENQLK